MPKTSEVKERCSKRVFSGERGDMMGHQCGRPVTRHEGKTPYCSTHYPPNVKKRYEEREAVWRANWDARELRYQIQAAERKVVEAAKAWATTEGGDQIVEDKLTAAIMKLMELEAKRDEGTKTASGR